jgi:hypothetical protein
VIESSSSSSVEASPAFENTLRSLVEANELPTASTNSQLGSGCTAAASSIRSLDMCGFRAEPMHLLWRKTSEVRSSASKLQRRLPGSMIETHCLVYGQDLSDRHVVEITRPPTIVSPILGYVLPEHTQDVCGTRSRAVTVCCVVWGWPCAIGLSPSASTEELSQFACLRIGGLPSPSLGGLVVYITIAPVGDLLSRFGIEEWCIEPDLGR